MKIVNTLQDTSLKDKILGYVGLFLIFIFSISLTRGISRVNLVKKELAKKRAEVIKIEERNKELEEQLAHVKSATYIEKEIRNKLGLVKTGEIVVVLPDAEVVKSLSPVIPTYQEPEKDPNWKRWLKLFM